MIIKADGRYIEITILHRTHPESIDFEDANWLDAQIKIEVPGFNGLYGTYLRANDFEQFREDLEKIIMYQSDKIEFSTMEEGIYLKGLLNATGNIKWKGVAKSSWGGSCLTFEIESDYSSINSLLNQAKEILREFPIMGL